MIPTKLASWWMSRLRRTLPWPEKWRNKLKEIHNLMPAKTSFLSSVQLSSTSWKTAWIAGAKSMTSGRQSKVLSTSLSQKTMRTQMACSQCLFCKERIFESGPAQKTWSHPSISSKVFQTLQRKLQALKSSNSRWVTALRSPHLLSARTMSSRTNGRND